MTPASTPDNLALEPVLERTLGNLPEGRVQTLAYDKACDDEAVHRWLAARGIRPVIENGSLWREELERVLEGAGIGNVVYDEAGTVYCPVQFVRDMTWRAIRR